MAAVILRAVSRGHAQQIRAVACMTTIRHQSDLADSDRIFQNLYGKHDWGLQGAMKRVRKYTTIIVLFLIF